MLAEPTARQMETARFMARYRAERGLWPTLEEIGEHLGVCKVTAHEHRRCLAEAGYVETEKHKARGARLTDAGYEIVGRPSSKLEAMKDLWRRASRSERKALRDWIQA